MPLDNIKTCLAVEGSAGGRAMLTAKVHKMGARRALYAGAAGAAAAHAISYVPWFLVHNALHTTIPRVDVESDGLTAFALRACLIGSAASAVSDTVSNSAHVLKVVKQTAVSARGLV